MCPFPGHVKQEVALDSALCAQKYCCWHIKQFDIQSISRLWVVGQCYRKVSAMYAATAYQIADCHSSALCIPTPFFAREGHALGLPLRSQERFGGRDEGMQHKSDRCIKERNRPLPGHFGKMQQLSMQAKVSLLQGIN